MKLSGLIAPFRNWSIAFKITTLFLTVILGIFFIATIILGFKWRDILTSGLMARGQLMSDNACARVNKIVDNTENIALLLANQLNIPEDTRQLSAEELDSIISKFSNNTAFILNDPDISGIVIAFNENTGFQGSPPLYHFHDNDSKEAKHIDNNDFLHAEWFNTARQSSKPFWTSPVKLCRFSTESCLYVVPVYHKEKTELICTLVIEVPLSSFDNIVNNIPIEGESSCLLHAVNGAPIAQSRNADQIKPNNIKKIHRITLSTTHDKESAYTYVGQEQGFSTGSNVFSCVCNNGWSVSLVMAGDWIETRLWTLARYVGGIFVLTMPLIILISYILTRHITAPLTRLSEAAEAIGGGRFNVPLPKYKGHDEIAMLTSSFEQMQRELALYLQELKKSFQKQETMESEINIAKTIQTGILPKVESAFLDSGQFDLDAVLIPAKGVGGDLYDFFYLDENHLVLIVGDVSGKGIPAALFMSVTQTLQRSIAFRFKNPIEIVNHLNEILIDNNEASMFVTYFIGIIDTCTGLMTYCNAGHNLPFIRRKNGNLDVISNQHGLPLGVFEATYACNEITLGVDDTLILYTDGVTEAFNPHDEVFGDIRLKEAIAYAMSPDPHAIVKTILKHMEIFVEEHEQSDDITLLCLQMKNTNCILPEHVN